MKNLHLLIFGFVFLTLASVLVHAEEPIRIGAIFSMSGYGADGIAELNGVLMAQEQINSAGGARGQPLEIIVEDNRSESKTTTSAFYQGVSGLIRFDEGGVIKSAANNTYLMQVKNGKFLKLGVASAS